jgi:hypothetical protein
MVKEMPLTAGDDPFQYKPRKRSGLASDASSIEADRMYQRRLDQRHWKPLAPNHIGGHSRLAGGLRITMVISRARGTLYRTPCPVA